MNRSRIFILFLVVASLLCVISLRRADSQSNGLRRITNTTEEGISINPSISGDGRIVAFESTEDVAGAGGSDHFRAIRGSISTDPASFFQMGGTRAVTPAISQDGSRIAFASKDDPLSANPDGNSEIFLFDGARLIQLTNTSLGDITHRVTNGNFQPSISDDGRFVAFSSNRDLTNQNADGNLEIFVYDVTTSAFTQLTNSSGIVGCTDAKISGDGNTVAYIRDTGATQRTSRDLLKQPRVGPGGATVLAANVQALKMTYGRAISDDGSRVVYSGETATNSSQVFLFDGRFDVGVRQITSLDARETDVPLHPTISGDGKRIALATRRNVPGAVVNPDGSVELYLYDIPTNVVSRLTNAPSSAIAEVVSSLNDDGSIVVFNFPRVLSGAVSNGNLANNSEIYVAATPARDIMFPMRVVHGASFGHEPSLVKAVAPDSIAVALDGPFAYTTQQTQRLPNGTFPTNVAGTTVTVNGRAAQIFFVSPSQVNFLFPPQTEIGPSLVIITNPDGFSLVGGPPVLRAAPGLFTKSGNGIGEGIILNGDTLQEGPFDPTNGNLRLSIFATGVHNASQTSVVIDGRVLNAETVMANPSMPGLDEVHVLVPGDLRGTGTVDLSVRCDGRDSNPVAVTFTGDPSRKVFINEVLADPPAGIAGDANHDGVRDGTQDEFVELVNGTSKEAVTIGGWMISTRASGDSTETTRFTFPAGTTLPAGEAIVVFGGGAQAFHADNPVFGCAQVMKATTSSGLSLTNSGLTVVVRDGAGNLIREFSYGESTGLDGDNNQSLTRSPDITGPFVQHTAAAGANGRRFSPGLKIDGTPFGNCPGHPATVTISPSSTSANVGQTAQFMAQTFDQYGRVMTGATMTFASDNTTVATIDSTSSNPVTGIATANVGAHNPGTAHVTASSNDATTTATSTPATLNVNGPVLSIDDVSANEGNSGTTTFTFTVTSTFPAPAGGITFDIASADGTATAASSDYVTRSLTSQTIPAGQNSYTFNVSVNGDTLVEPNETFFVNLTNPTGGATIGDSQGVGTIENDDVANVVISQTYPGGGLTGASFTNDFIELFNRGVTTVDFAVTPYSIQFLSTGATTWAKTDLTSGTLALERYFLIKETGGTNGAPLPTADATGTLNLTSTTAGKVALVSGTALLTGNCPGDDGTAPFNPINSAVADFIGYGATASTANHCYEGSGPASLTLSNNTIAEFRKAGGCTNTNDNAADFFTATPFPRNSSSPVNNCAGGVAPNLSINDVTVVEGNGGTTTATFTVSLSAPAQGTDVNFDIATANGTATTANSDYVAKSLTNQIIPAGQTSYTFSVIVNGDTAVEPDETFFINLTNVVGATVADSQGLATIQNDDFPTLSINDVSGNEGDSGTTTFSFTVSLSAPASAPITFDIATADGTAIIADNDYVAKSLTGQTISTGQQTYHFDVTVNGDMNVEPNETFFVNLTNVTGATITDGQGQGTIRNDDSPALSISDVSANEGNSSTTTFTFTVSLSHPAQADGVSFDIATADGTASAGSADYVTRSLTGQTIPAGQSTYTFEVTVNGDTLVEPHETFFVNLTNVSGASVLDGQAQGTILNDDVPLVVISQVYGGGGNSGATYKNDFVELFNRGTTTVNFAITPHSIQYAGATSTFGSSKVDLTTGVLAPGHYFLVQLSSGGANGVALPTPDATGSINMASTAVKVALVSGTTALSGSGCPLGGTIVDFVGYGTTADCSENSTRAPAPSNTTADFRKAGGCTDTNDNAADFLVAAPFPRNTASPTNNCVAGARPDLSINDVTVTEGNSGTTIATFTVSLSAPAPSTDISFDIATQNNTATTANSDYVARSLTNQIIPSGVTTYTFDVTVDSDTSVEPDETFFVNVTNVVGANLLDGQGVGTIHNDDLPTLSINDVSLTEGNAGTKLFTFTVSLSAAAPANVTFDIATQDDTATVANDYVARSLTGQTITTGNQIYTFDVTVEGDTAIETNETFFVNVTNVSGATILDGQGVGTIQNDDSPALSINDVAVTEGNSGPTTAMFTVTLSPSSTQTVTVDYATAPGTAAAGTDYQSTNGTLTFNPGDTTKPINVLVNGDTTNEAICETFFVNLTNQTNATISDNQGQGGITDDDGTKLVISQVYGGGGNSGAQYTNDFIEIFNRGNTAISLNGLSVQYTAATATSGNYSVTTLPNVNLQAGQYFLIQEAAGGAVGAALPTPDATSTIAMAATAGKVVLVNGTAALSAVGCPSGATILDFVGYGTTANCREGSTTADNAPAPSNTTADLRKLTGCQDANNNNADFAAGTPAPRNTSSPAAACSCSTSYASLLLFDGELWKTNVAALFIDRRTLLKPRPAS